MSDGTWVRNARPVLSKVEGGVIHYGWLGYDLQVLQGPNMKWTIWVELYGETMAGPCMDYPTHDEAINDAMCIVRELERGA